MYVLCNLLALLHFLRSTSSTLLNAENGPDFLQKYPEVQNIAKDFGVGGKGGKRRPDLWLKGAALIIPQLNTLIDFVSPGFEMESMTVEEGHKYFEMKQYKDKVDLLDHHLKKFGSDKSIFYQHFHHVYAYVFEKLGATNRNLRTLEIGMGTNNPKLVSTMGANGKPGASLRAFSKYLPDTAAIFGADIDKDILFQSEQERIRTTFVDGYNYSSYEKMYVTFGSQPFDFIIDDAAHALATDLNTLLFALLHVNIPGYIVIEDVDPGQFPTFRVIDYLLKTRVSNDVVINSSMVFTAHRKNGQSKRNPYTKSMIYVISVSAKV